MKFFLLLLVLVGLVWNFQAEEVAVEVEVGADGDVNLGISAAAETEEKTGPTPPPSPPPAAQARSVNLINRAGQPVRLWWDAGKDAMPIDNGVMSPNQPRLVNSFVGHRFFITEMSIDDCNVANDRKNRIDRCTITDKDTVCEFQSSEEKSRQKNADRETERHFRDHYRQETGRTWQNYYPRKPVSYYMYNVTHIGQTFTTISHHSQFVVCPSAIITDAMEAELDEKERLDWEGLAEDIAAVADNPYDEFRPSAFQFLADEQYVIIRYNGTNYCRNKTGFDLGSIRYEDHDYSIYDDKSSEYDLELELEVLCDDPKVIRINNFLSEDECDHIIELGNYLGLARSTVADDAIESKSRTSSTVWLRRDKSPIVDQVVKRIADTVRIPHERLFVNYSSESLQLVHYFEGQKYNSHHDYGTMPPNYPNNRYITFLMYLNTQASDGGNTSFPQASQHCRDENNYFGLNPGKTNAQFFYDLLRDGNVDPKTLHYAEPPKDNDEKYMTNLWIWEPLYPLHSKIYRD